jgi:exopolysaccharide biosynthesis WecB/TagA/CpsF family protein
MDFVISQINPLEILEEKKVFNFINLNTIWWLRKDNFYRGLMLSKGNINFPDGKILAFFSRLKQVRGPTFTRDFLMSKKAKNKKHFFIGLERMDLEKLSKITKIPIKRLYCYNPPYIKTLEFSFEERKKIVNLLKKVKPNFIWVCVGSPKQEVLANQLFEKFRGAYFNVGVATDFLLGKKEEAPSVFRKFGLEWFYRLVTDFKYSKKKVWRSFVGTKYLIFKEVKILKVRN